MTRSNPLKKLFRSKKKPSSKETEPETALNKKATSTLPFCRTPASTTATTTTATPEESTKSNATMNRMEIPQTSRTHSATVPQSPANGLQGLPSPAKVSSHSQLRKSRGNQENLAEPQVIEASDGKDEPNDAPAILQSYDTIPVIEMVKLPRGGVSMETQAVGFVQFGIPPETIKDSMRLGLGVPTVYIVPVERFCRESGPALGVNLAEFEFPAYFNFFVQRKRCTLIVDSDDAEQNICRVFSETLLGPGQFRRDIGPMTHEPEDFAPDFNRAAIPNFAKELKHFRMMPDGKELVLETLLKFCHFNSPGESGVHENLGVPQSMNGEEEDEMERELEEEMDEEMKECPDATEEELNDEQSAVPEDLKELERLEKKRRWTYSNAKFNGNVATVWPSDATPEQIASRVVKRAEIFKMPGGTEYILHDIDANNIIVGKARFSGHVKVSESMSVAGFGTEKELLEKEPEAEDDDSSELTNTFMNHRPPTFHPPSFGVTVLGNSHGFDKSGSTSGYVLWINGRGVMIDPPPYSSFTLEREGIRSRMIVAIILTHCHADHDAGAFQKVLTGQPVVVITTPTIYKSFIRKYAALSALSPALLRHSHRYKAAIIGQPLRFQGATFHFTYSLHTIPCVGFRVEWRGRSLVFTGDHFNNPPAIDKLQESGVLTRARADDLRNLPLQETDLLLHEAGAPPIHTPLDVLMQLPDRVKKRMYVVHTSALPEGCELRVAPTGTAGTIRLDKMNILPQRDILDSRETSLNVKPSRPDRRESFDYIDDGLFQSPWSGPNNEYETISEDSMQSSEDSTMSTSSSTMTTPTNARPKMSSRFSGGHHTPPLVSLRPASSTDAWFLLNLLSAVPFLTSLSYTSTMEVLETAKVDAYCIGDVILPTNMRPHLLCVVWEGTCVERTRQGSQLNASSIHPKRNSTRAMNPIQEINAIDRDDTGSVWHAGDWTGPIALQPEKHLSGESELSKTHDIVAMSLEGVKVITIEFSSLHTILKSGSALYRKYLERRAAQEKVMESIHHSVPLSFVGLGTNTQKELSMSLSVLELLDLNSAFCKLSAVQKRHLESLAEGPVTYNSGERLWTAGAAVDKAYIIVAGTVSFVQRRRNADSVPTPSQQQRRNESSGRNRSLGESMQIDAIKAITELGDAAPDTYGEAEEIEPRRSESKHIQLEKSNEVGEESEDETERPSVTEAHDFERLSCDLKKYANTICKTKGLDSFSWEESSHDDYSDLNDDASRDELGHVPDGETRKGESESNNYLVRRRSSRARFANKVLGRLYSRRAFTGGLVFSRGHFLGDVSKMVAGKLLSASTAEGSEINGNSNEVGSLNYGFGEKRESGADNLQSIENMVIHEEEGGEHIVHSSTLTAGKDGCVVLVFPRASLNPFLDEYPGFLLSLLGT